MGRRTDTIQDYTKRLCPTCGCCSVGRMGICAGGCGPRGGRSRHDRAVDALSGPKSGKTTQDTGSALERHLTVALRAHGLPEPEREYRFHETRRWRADFCWPAQRLVVEIEGGIYRGGGHTSVTGLKRDIEKGNALTMGGWRVLRFHGDQVKSGEAVELIRRALEV